MTATFDRLADFVFDLPPQDIPESTRDAALDRTYSRK